MKKTYDLIIVGAGLTGSSLAYWWRQRNPKKKLLLIEREKVAFGASGRNAGFLTTGSLLYLEKLVNKHGTDGARDIWNFSRQNRELLIHKKLLPEQSRKNGSYTLLRQRQVARNAEALYRQEAWPLEHLDEQELKKMGLLGFLGGALWDKDEFSIPPQRLVHSILEGAKPYDFVKTQFTDYTAKGQEVEIHSSAGSFQSSLLLLATHHELSSHIIPTENQVLLTQPMEHGLNANFYDPEQLAYFRPHSSGGLIVGGLRNRPGKNLKEKVVNYLSSHLPLLREFEIQRQWTGHLAMSPCQLPQILVHPMKTVWGLGGYSGHGLGMSFHCAKQLIEHIEDGHILPHFLQKKSFSQEQESMA